LTLGPIPFLWEKEQILRFYDEVAETAVSDVYLGEVVCSKRALLGPGDLRDIASRLEAAGKRVILSTLGIVTHPEELEESRRLCELPYPIEVNNMGVLDLLQGEDREIIAGPHIALYNGDAAKFFSGIGFRRMVFMPELDLDAMASICEESMEMEKELIVYGHLPLAFSWRCYTARAVDLEKDNCGIVCRKYPEGMPLDTLDGQPIFNINGTELVSAQKHCLLEHLDLVLDLGIRHLRIVPQSVGTPNVIDLFSRVLSGSLSAEEAVRDLSENETLSNGWFFGRAGWEYISRSQREPQSGMTAHSRLPVM
jgi:collagenase-like PrtC family protease